MGFRKCKDEYPGYHSVNSEYYWIAECDICGEVFEDHDIDLDDLRHALECANWFYSGFDVWCNNCKR